MTGFFRQVDVAPGAASVGVLLAVLVCASCSTFGDWDGGIGAVLRHSGEDRRLTIEEIPAESPSAEAGLRPGDEIIAIGGRFVSDMTASDVVEALRGEVGTTVTLTVVRENGGEPFDVEIARAPYR